MSVTSATAGAPIEQEVHGHGDCDCLGGISWLKITSLNALDFESCFVGGFVWTKKGQHKGY